MSDNRAKNNRIAKNTLLLYLRMGVVLLISLYTTRVILRVLGVEDYGVYNVVCGFVSLFNVLSSTLSSGINRFYNFEIGKHGRSAITTVYNVAIVIQLLIIVVVLLFVETIGVWYLNNKMVIPPERMDTARWVFQFSIASMVVMILKTPYSAAVMACEKMDFFAIMSVIDACCKLLIVFIISAVSYDKLMLYGFLMLLITLFDLLAYILYCRVMIKEIRLLFPIDKTLFKEMVSFSGWMVLDPIAYSLRGQGSNVVLNYFFGPIINTAYGLANQVHGALDSMSSSLSTAFRPQMIQSYGEGDYQRTRRLMFSMSKITFYLKVMLSVPLFYELNYVFNIWLGNSYPEHTLSFTSFYIIINLVNTLNIPITHIMMATGRIKRYMIFTFFIVSSLIPLSVLVFTFNAPPEFLFVLLLTLSIINQFVCVILLAQSFPAISVSDYCKSVIIPCVFQLVVVSGILLVPHLLFEQSFFRFLLSCMLSVAVSLLSAYTISLDNEEKKMLRSIILRVTKRVFHSIRPLIKSDC